MFNTGEKQNSHKAIENNDVSTLLCYQSLVDRLQLTRVTKYQRNL